MMTMLPIRKSPLGFPMAPTQAEWDALTDAERAQVVEALPNQVTYDEMAPPEGDQHQNAKNRALSAVRTYFRSQKRRAYVTAELPVYYQNAPRFAPDVLVVFDVEDPERGKWVVSDEGRGLDWVLEVHYGGDRKKDAVRNVARYAQLGIPEYFLFDRSRGELYAYRLATPQARVYVPIMPQRGLYPSAVLGLDVQVEKERVRFFAGSAMLLETEELITRLERVTAEALDRAEEETHRAEEERRLRMEAEAETVQLRGELDALRKG